MDKNQILEKKRRLQLLFFNDIVNLNNIRFTSKYFQILAGQEENNIAIKSIGAKEFFRICKNINIKELKKRYFKNYIENEFILVGRGSNGELKGSINIRPNNEVRISYTDHILQEKIIEKNIKKRNIALKEIIPENF